jgi:hypothetical protein
VSWIGWTVIGIMIFDILMFGSLWVVFTVEEKKGESK